MRPCLLLRRNFGKHRRRCGTFSACERRRGCCTGGGERGRADRASGVLGTVCAADRAGGCSGRSTNVQCGTSFSERGGGKGILGCPRWLAGSWGSQDVRRFSLPSAPCAPNRVTFFFTPATSRVDATEAAIAARCILAVMTCSTPLSAPWVVNRVTFFPRGRDAGFQGRSRLCSKRTFAAIGCKKMMAS